MLCRQCCGKDAAVCNVEKDNACECALCELGLSDVRIVEKIQSVFEQARWK